MPKKTKHQKLLEHDNQRDTKSNDLAKFVTLSSRDEEYKQNLAINVSPNSRSSQKSKEQKKQPQTPPISFFKLFSYINCTQKIFLIIGTLASIATGIGLPLISIILGDITNDTTPDPSQINSMIDQMKQTSYKMFYIGAGIFVTSYFSFAFWMMTGERVAIQIRKAYFRAILRQDVEWFDTSNPQELSTKINQQCTLVQKAVGEKVANVIMSLSMMITGLFIAFFKGWQIALILLGLAPLLVISVILLTKTVQGSEKQSQKAYAKSGGYAQECIGQIRTVASYCGEQKEVDKYVQHLDVAKRAGISSAIKAGLGTGIFWFSMFLSYAVGFYFGGLSVRNEWNDTRGNKYTSGEVITIFFAVIFGIFSLGMAAPNLRAIGEGLAAGSQIFATIERQPRINLGEFNDQIKVADLNGHIEFNNVEFAYPSRPEQMVLKGVSLKFQPGKTTAIVGATGSGKSTIIQLIERFYDPLSGNITIDGQQLAQVNINMLRKKLIGYVGQQPVLFNTSIFQNIKFGKEDATEQEVIQALKKANAWDFVQSLKDGVQTNVGALGSQMSGGQKQRLAIARAIVKNPKILLLDQATSALDMRSEKVVQQALQKVSEGLTTIVIAHRLSTIQNADCIITLQKGQVAQIGTHEQLLENVQGVYTNLVKAQIYQANEDDEEEDQQLQINDQQLAQRFGSRQDLVDLVNNNSQQQDINAGSPVKSLKNGNKISEQFKTPLLQKQKSSQSRPIRRSTKKSIGSVIVNNPKKFLELVTEQQAEQKKKLNELLDEKQKTITSRLFQHTKRFPGSFCFGILSSIILGATFPVFAILFAQVSVQMTAFNVPFFDTSQNYDNFRLNCIYFVVIGVVSGLFQMLMVLFFSIIGQNITRVIREQLYKSILSRPISWFDDQNNEAGKLNSALSSDTSQLNSVVSQSVGMYFQSIAAILLGVIFGMIYSWRLGLVLLGLSPFMLIAGAMQAKIQMGFSANIDQAYKESSSLVSQSVTNYRTVMSFANQDLILKHYEDKLNSPFSSGVKRSHISGLLFGYSQFSQWLVYGVAFFLAAVFLSKGWIDSSEHMFKAIYCLLFGAYGAGQAQAFAPDIVKAAQSAKSVFRLLDQPNDNNPFEEEQSGKLLKQRAMGRIQFKNVWFKYPSRKEWVLQGLNMVIEPGQSIALVGQSGCGKSTIISLLQRFYQIQRGQIILDGQNINDLNLKSLRQQMALVSQEPLLFDATISQNIAYGRNSASFEEIAEAAENANALEFIKSGEEGFDRKVGTRGSQLSGGQKQRVAIARAILKKPSILLLDEATSALDKESEAIVQQALDKIMKFQTSIVIAHRLSTIENVDKVFMLEEGKVVESGGYQQLLNDKNGAFHKLAVGQY